MKKRKLEQLEEENKQLEEIIIKKQSELHEQEKILEKLKTISL